MKVTMKLIKNGAPGTIEDVSYVAIGAVLWEDDWVRLVPLDSRIQQISYRKDLVFAVIEEKENYEDPRD